MNYCLHQSKFWCNDEAYLAPNYTQPNPTFNLASKLDASMVDASGNIVANDYNWYNQGTHTGHIIDNQLSVSGGGDKFNYLLSGNMTDQSANTVCRNRT